MTAERVSMTIASSIAAPSSSPLAPVANLIVTRNRMDPNSLRKLFQPLVRQVSLLRQKGWGLHHIHREGAHGGVAHAVFQIGARLASIRQFTQAFVDELDQDLQRAAASLVSLPWSSVYPCRPLCANPSASHASTRSTGSASLICLS
jgi:hypothetical protein